MNLIKYTFLCGIIKNQKTPQKYHFIRTQRGPTRPNLIREENKPEFIHK